jgi:hypothetical protein
VQEEELHPLSFLSWLIGWQFAEGILVDFPTWGQYKSKAKETALYPAVWLEWSVLISELFIGKGSGGCFQIELPSLFPLKQAECCKIYVALCEGRQIKAQ